MINLPDVKKNRLNNFLEIMEKINSKMEELEIPKENFVEILKVYFEAK